MYHASPLHLQRDCPDIVGKDIPRQMMEIDISLECLCLHSNFCNIANFSVITIQKHIKQLLVKLYAILSKILRI